MKFAAGMSKLSRFLTNLNMIHFTGALKSRIARLVFFYWMKESLFMSAIVIALVAILALSKWYLKEEVIR